MAPFSEKTAEIIFFPLFKIHHVPIPFILVWLAGAGIFFTFYFKAINVRYLPLAFRTLRGRYSSKKDPGEITHFQALSTALSGTVGLGNIAGVAIAISMGGPGAAFWMIVMGFLGMSTKFAECTLGVKYRHISKKGRIHGGAMQYLQKGLQERGVGKIGRFFSYFFSVVCIGSAFGAGNMFQVNQVCSQFIEISGGKQSILNDSRWVFGLMIAILTGSVILGGIKRIAKVTSRLVPLMCATYLIGALIILCCYASHIPSACKLILLEAFSPQACAGGFWGTLLLGVQRATFSNEAGIGSSPIVHSAAKTSFPASEGIVALLEPLFDTLIVCSSTALIIVVTGVYQQPENSARKGIEITSQAFGDVLPWFPFILFIAVSLFAFSTLLTWAYYGQQAWEKLFGHRKLTIILYKVIFCVFILIGSSISLKTVIDFSDALFLSLCFPNLIGVYLLTPVIKNELNKFLMHTQQIDKKIKNKRLKKYSPSLK